MLVPRALAWISRLLSRTSRILHVAETFGISILTLLHFNHNSQANLLKEITFIMLRRKTKGICENI